MAVTERMEHLVAWLRNLLVGFVFLTAFPLHAQEPSEEDIDRTFAEFLRAMPLDSICVELRCVAIAIDPAVLSASPGSAKVDTVLVLRLAELPQVRARIVIMPANPLSLGRDTVALIPWVQPTATVGTIRLLFEIHGSPAELRTNTYAQAQALASLPGGSTRYLGILEP